LCRPYKARLKQPTLTQGVALGYKYYALSWHVFVRLNGSEPFSPPAAFYPLTLGERIKQAGGLNGYGLTVC
jgi:hypothetical protein